MACGECLSPIRDRAPRLQKPHRRRWNFRDSYPLASLVAERFSISICPAIVIAFHLRASKRHWLTNQLSDVQVGFRVELSHRLCWKRGRMFRCACGLRKAGKCKSWHRTLAPRQNQLFPPRLSVRQAKCEAQGRSQFGRICLGESSPSDRSLKANLTRVPQTQRRCRSFLSRLRRNSSFR